VIPIAVFIHAAFLVMVRRLLGLGAVAGVAATLASPAAPTPTSARAAGA
jgi:hypothetical protein